MEMYDSSPAGRAPVTGRPGVWKDGGMSSSSARQRVPSGVRATADSYQLGHYLGARRNCVAMQENNATLYCVEDLHPITTRHDPVTRRARTRASAAQLFAAGLDPERCTLFV